jgi:hypothetical protein
MNLRHCIGSTRLGVLLLFVAGSAFGESCPSLVGSWSVVAESASFSTSPTISYSYVDSAGTLNIFDQEGCLFQAVYQRTDVSEPAQPLTGAIGPGSEITLTGVATIARGKLVGPRRIEAVVSDLAPGGGTINTTRATATR